MNRVLIKIRFDDIKQNRNPNNKLALKMFKIRFHIHRLSLMNDMLFAVQTKHFLYL